MNQASGPTPGVMTSDQAMHAQWSQNQPTSSPGWTEDRPKQGVSLQRRSFSRKSGSDKRDGTNLHVIEACNGTNYGPTAIWVPVPRKGGMKRETDQTGLTTQVASQPVFYSSQPSPASYLCNHNYRLLLCLEMSRPARVRK